MRFPMLVSVAASLAACASTQRADMPVGSGAVLVGGQSVMGQDLALQAVPTYRIGPSDKLKLSVFQVPDLSFDEIFVDASGYLQIPLVGQVEAAGRTPAELSNEIATLLGTRYLRDPQVNVTVIEAASQKITVDGAVTKPGVYEMRGRTSLIQAIAMAEGAVRTADLQHVAVFRSVDGQRMVAVFNVRDIRNGVAQDPVLQGDDIVVVDTSRLSEVMRDALTLLPTLAVFTRY